MTTSSNPVSGTDQGGNSPLDEALKQNQEATQEVHKAAEDLAVAHAVLDVKAAGGALDDDGKKAVEDTANVERRLTQSAEKLEQANETLQREMPKRN